MSKSDHETFRVIVGSLLYLSCWTCPDISFAASELSRFLSDPRAKNFQAAKRVLRHLKGPRDVGLNYSWPEGEKLNRLRGYVDLDWPGCIDTRSLTTDFVLMFSGAAISWKSKRLNVVCIFSDTGLKLMKAVYNLYRALPRFNAADCTALLTAAKTDAEKPVAVAVFRGNWRKRCTSPTILFGSFGDVTALTL